MVLSKNFNKNIDANAYEYKHKNHADLQDSNYIRLLLQEEFNPKNCNIILFIYKEPSIYSIDKLINLEGYFNNKDLQLWQPLLKNVLNTGKSFNQQISNLMIYGQSVGNSYIILTEYKSDDLDDIIFLQKNLKSVTERAKKYKEYCDLIKDPFWIRDKNLNLLFVNQSFLTLASELTIDDVINNSKWICNKSKADILAQLALQKNDLQTMETTFIQEGKTFYGLISETPVHDEEGGIFLFGRLQDINKEKNLAQRVKNLESGIKDILTNISIAASIFDKNRRLRFYNQAFIDLWGLNVDYLETAPDHLDILDKLRAKRLIPESRDFKNWKNEVLAPYHDLKAFYENIWYTPQKQTIKCTVSPYADGGVICLQENITAHVTLEQSHTILSQNLRNTLDALDEGIILCDTNGKLKVLNKKITEIFKTDIALHSHLAVLYDNFDNELGDFLKKIYSFIQNGFPNPEKYTQECLLDDVILIASAVRLSTSDILIHIRDQTALLNYQKMLHDKAESLQENEHIRESFFRRISHNLRDPMTSVAGYAELLQTEIFGTLNDKQREYITDMRYSIDDLLRLTDNLADLVRLDSHVLNDFSELSLQETLFSAIQAMQNEAFSRNITLTRHIDSNFIINGDQTLLRQSFIQLLENPIMVTRRGGEILIEIKEEQEYVSVKITDQGIGMPNTIKDAILTKKIANINGYGLRYVLRVIGLHQATCHVNILTDPVEKITGTCIEVCFPLNHKI
jgi:PAS domain S-box-containing protein